MSQEFLNIPEVEEYLIKGLKEQGFIVQKYEATSTSSAYLKLDYGVANSIRISDHKGKRYLSYRFNVEIGRKTNTVKIDNKGYTRIYYTSRREDLDKLIKAAKESKKAKLVEYGEKKYKDFMKANQKTGQNRARYTFWHKARVV